MAVAADAERLALERRLRHDTPFWAGGVTRDSSGGWVLPAAGEFPGVAKIVDKNARLVTIVPRPWQIEFDDLLEQQRREGKPMRAIVLKARKLGFSTWIALKMLQRLTQIEYQHGIIVAQDVRTAGVIFAMAQTCHAHLPTMDELPIGFSIRPAIVAQRFSPTGRKFMQFGESSKRLRENGRTGDSLLEIDTAGTPEAGRGTTPTLLHLSEPAWWEGEQATRKMIALLNAIPETAETMVVLESTANGLNHFYRRWVAARDGAKDPDTGETYAHIFVPWWRDPEAARPFPTIEDRERFAGGIGDTQRFGEIAEDEPMLTEAYGCTPEQLAWRRTMIRTKHEGSVELFNQENPHSDEAAFIGSGRTVFSGILIARAIKAAQEAPEPVVGTLAPTNMVEKRIRSGTLLVPEGAEWVPAEKMGPKDHELRVWEHPVKAGGGWPEDVPPERRVDGAYVVAVDVASGEANTFTRGDYHAVQVFNHRTRAQAAVHRSRMDIQLLPFWALLIAHYYNRAYLAVEVNNQGIAVLEPLHKSYRYPMMYRRRRVDHVREQTQELVGWSTDRVTKPLMEGTMAGALQEGTAGVRDVATARELTTYVVTEKGKHEAQEGEHDDLLMAAMIAHQVMELLQPPPEVKRRRRRRQEWDSITGYGH